VEFLKIVLVGLGAAVVYGVVHDQVTARVCVEYFTIGHPPLINSDSPTLLGLAWGVVATWWVGLPLGLILAVAARVGRLRKCTINQVRPLLVRLLAVMAIAASLAGSLGYVLALYGVIWLSGDGSDAIPVPVRARFLADLWAHSASYLVGVFGGVVVAGLVYRRRRFAPSGMVTGSANR
jgi:hypothetical protein